MLPFYQGGARGTNVRRNRIARSDFLAIPVAVPPLPEQRKIAAILSSVDEAIEGTQAVIDQLQVVKKAMMADLLTRGIPGRHKTFKQTEIGEVPAEWEVKAVEGVGAVDAGKARDPQAEGIPRPYLRVANVFDGEIRVDDVYEMPFTDAEFERFALQFGDVLLNEGQSIELVGRCSLYRNELSKPCAIQNALLRFRAVGPVSAEFAEQYFRWCQYSGRFAEIATQTTSIAHLGLRRFASMRMPVPSLTEQSEIVGILASIDGRIGTEENTLLALKATKSALMSVLLTGEVRVKVDEESAA
jgi:type I restriction enzyme S subunit